MRRQEPAPGLVAGKNLATGQVHMIKQIIKPFSVPGKNFRTQTQKGQHPESLKQTCEKKLRPAKPSRMRPQLADISPERENAEQREEQALTSGGRSLHPAKCRQEPEA